MINGVTTTETFFQQNLSYQIANGSNLVRIRLINRVTSITNPDLKEINIAAFDNQIQISDLCLPSVISIYDITGSLVLKTTTKDYSTIIPFYQKGVFIVTVENEMQNFNRKVVL